MVSEVFLSFLITSIIGLIFGLGKICYKSKCKEVNICGIKILRDTEMEEKENEFMATHTESKETTLEDLGKK